MESRVLNFVDAINLAKLISTSGMDTIELSMPGVTTLLSNIQPVVFLNVLSLLSGKSSQELSGLSGNDALILLLTGLKENKINELISFMKLEGLSNGI